MYYDMHSHILPEMDDGSKSVEMSLELIEKLRKQDVKNICLTPHFYTNEESLDTFVERRQKSLEKLLPHIPDDVNICVGAEVYVTRYLFNNKDLSRICYGDSKYILCEFSFSSHFSEHTMDYFNRLRGNYGLRPVLTHIERYENLMANEKARAGPWSTRIFLSRQTSEPSSISRRSDVSSSTSSADTSTLSALTATIRPEAIPTSF